MSKTMKAVLLSALVFPGAGHLSLKKYVPGLALLAVAASGLYFIVSKAIEHAMKVVEQIEVGTVFDIAAITELASQQAANMQGELLSVATLVIIIAWVIGIIDCYRLGRALDKKNEPTS